MLGLRMFNVVFAGTGFPVQQIQATDFEFHGHRLKVDLHVAQAFQATVDEFTVQLLSERFQVGAAAGKATKHRIEALCKAALTFADEYAGKRSISAVGHNFAGSFDSAFGSANAFMRHISWQDDFASIIASEEEPTLSLTTRFHRGDRTASVIRLEPSAEDDGKVFYDINFSWGKPGEPLPLGVPEILSRYEDSLREASDIVEDLARLGTKGGAT
jgi:hypothetical protein